ncbi:MAG: hypothetical protein NC318_09095 [Blautia sp.]|nr:hypothetical protein [Lachnoclostridium sp.]MCM1211746.1 hypothetical protein [Blautia sp.]
MKIQGIWKKYGNCILMTLTILVNAIIMGVCFDFYYDLNDDMMMKDIMAGVYTGTPDGHNMQTLYILGAFISLCYRLCRNFPWYGLFLCLCQFGALYLAGVRMLKICAGRLAKAGVLLFTTVFLWGILLPHMAALQYTITCAMLTAAAIFLFLTTEKGLAPGAFVRHNIPSILLVVLAYQLRTEMLLLVFPLIGLAGLFRMAEEKAFFQKENYCKYGLVIGGILIGMLVSRLLDFAAYGDEGWKSFLTFFEKRTQVYDFHYDILTSGEHRDELAAMGISDAQQQLLANYNFGLDEGIDEEVLGRIADYAAERESDAADYASEQESDAADYATEQESGAAVSTGRQSNGAELLRKLWQQWKLSVYRMLHEGDMPYNLPVVLGYLCVIVCGVWEGVTNPAKKGLRKWIFLWKPGLLFLVRSCLWMYILMKGRDPERITHSLYLAEFALLAGMLVMGLVRDKEVIIGTIIFLLLGAFCLWRVPGSVRGILENQRAREAANQGQEAIDTYCRAHPDCFYFEDVYSTVGFSQKIFQNVDNSLANYDIMGGWMCKSPLYREKLKQFGIETTAEGLLYMDSVFFIMETGTADSSTAWMEDYYAEQGIDVGVEQADVITQKYAVYRILNKAAEKTD